MRSQNRRIYLAIIAISTVLMLVVFNLSFKVKPFGDDTFHVESKNVALALKGVVPFEEIVITRAPGPVLFYTPVYFLAPTDATDQELWLYGIVFTSIMMTLSLLLIYKTAIAFFSPQIAILALLLCLGFPIHCYYSLGIMSEAPAFIAVAVALYGWSKAYRKPGEKMGWALLVGGILFLILNRPNALLIFGLVFLALLYAYFKEKDFFATYAKPIMVSFAIIFVLGIGTLQMARIITEKEGNPRQENLLYYVLFQGRFQFREEPMDLRYWDNTSRAGSKDYKNWKTSFNELENRIVTNDYDFAKIYNEFLINDILENPGITIRQFFIRCIYGNIYTVNSVNPENFEVGPFKGKTVYYGFMILINTINIFIIVGVFVFLFKGKNQMVYWPFWSIILGLMLFHGLTYMEPRYLFPAKVPIYIFAAAGLYRFKWIQKIMNKTATLMLTDKK